MKQVFLAIPLLMLAGCAKKAPISQSAKPIPAPEQQASTQNRTPQPQVNTRTAPTPQANNNQTRNTGLTPAERAQLNTAIGRLEDALFDYDQATIRPDAMQRLQADGDVVKTILTQHPEERLRLEGNADERGSSEYNLGLGDRRAESVLDFLANLGIPRAQLSAVSYGKDKPVCTESTETCWQRNRRVHLVSSTATPTQNQ